MNGRRVKKDFARPGVVDLYNNYMGGVDVSDQRAVAYARLMKGVVWYYKVFFYMVEVCVSNAQILQTKSQEHTTMRRFDFRKNLITQLVQGRCFRKGTGLPQLPVPLPDIRFNRDHFHYLVTNETRSTCKVHVQRVKTVYSCAICGFRMCPDPCFKRFQSMQDYFLDDATRDGPRQLK